MSEVTPRATYIRDAPALMADPVERAKLSQLVHDHEISVVIPYSLAKADPLALRDWFDEIRRNGGRVIVPIAGADRLTALAGTRVDGFISEFEYWNQPNRPLDDLMTLLAQMRAFDNHGYPFTVGAYLGSPTEAEATRLATAVDFVFVDASVSSPDRAWSRVRNRFEWFHNAHVAVWPIFYATGEVDMNAALQAKGIAGAEAQFKLDSGGRNAGFAYFTFEATPW
jgi:hypothetical protein